MTRGLGPAIILLAMAASSAPAQSAEEAAIRLAREASNRAIAAHDIDGVAAHWTETFQITTSAGGQRSGREASRADFARHFAERPDVVYVRTPDRIQVFGPWGMAAESGRWTGQWTQEDGVTRIGGSYYAQWRKVEGRWLIHAEVFVPDWCEGTSWCAKRPG